MIGTAKDENLDEFVEDDAVGDAWAMAPERMRVWGAGRKERGELVPDGFDEP